VKLSTTAFKKIAHDACRGDRAWGMEDAARELAAGAPADAESFYRALVAQMLTSAIGGSTRPGDVHEANLGLLWILTDFKKKKADERLREARKHVLGHIELYTSWHALLDDPSDPTARAYQLHGDGAWWKPSEDLTWLEHELPEDLAAAAARGEGAVGHMASRGYQWVDQSTWQKRVKDALVFGLATVNDSERVAEVVRWIVVLTAPRFKLSPEMWPELELGPKLLGAELRTLYMGITRRKMVSIPRKPLAVLPMEVDNMSRFASGIFPPATPDPGDERSLGVANSGKGARLRLTGGAEPALLLTDRSLVKKATPDTFIKIPLSAGAPTEDPVGALVHSLAGFSELGRIQRADHLAHIPRVVAGVFMLAHRDALGPGDTVAPGEFLDTGSAHRLTRAIGLDATDRRARERVAMVRHWLTQIQLVREVVEVVGGRRIKTHWMGPVLTELSDRYRIGEDLDAPLAPTGAGGEGQSGKKAPEELRFVREELMPFRLAPVLWRMSEHDSGTSEFMLLDHRAFELDDAFASSTSAPFNLYWTIVQRAYMAPAAHDPADRMVDGTFGVMAKTLFRLSGIEDVHHGAKRGRAYDKLALYLDLMIDKGLIADWSCDVARGKDLGKARVSITMPATFAQYLSPPALEAGARIG